MFFFFLNSWLKNKLPLTILCFVSESNKTVESSSESKKKKRKKENRRWVRREGGKRGEGFGAKRKWFSNEIVFWNSHVPPFLPPRSFIHVRENIKRFGNTCWSERSSNIDRALRGKNYLPPKKSVSSLQFISFSKITQPHRNYCATTVIVDFESFSIESPISSTEWSNKEIFFVSHPPSSPQN